MSIEKLKVGETVVIASTILDMIATFKKLGYKVEYRKELKNAKKIVLFTDKNMQAEAEKILGRKYGAKKMKRKDDRDIWRTLDAEVHMRRVPKGSIIEILVGK